MSDLGGLQRPLEGSTAPGLISGLRPWLAVAARKDKLTVAGTPRAHSPFAEVGRQGREQPHGPGLAGFGALFGAERHCALHEERPLTHITPSEPQRFAWPQPCVASTESNAASRGPDPLRIFSIVAGASGTTSGRTRKAGITRYPRRRRCRLPTRLRLVASLTGALFRAPAWSDMTSKLLNPSDLAEGT